MYILHIYLYIVTKQKTANCFLWEVYFFGLNSYFSPTSEQVCKNILPATGALVTNLFKVTFGLNFFSSFKVPSNNK